MLTDLAAIEALLDVQPSYFELLTAAAFRWFSDEAVSAAVVEVGLLGRWDATNVVDGVVAVLTNVGHDHTDGQGDWRRRIAEEKAGIVKEGATFVLGETDPALADVFDGTPAAEVWRRDVDFACESNELAVGGRLLDLRTPGCPLRGGVPPAPRRPPGRERGRRAGGGRGVLRAGRSTPTSCSTPSRPCATRAGSRSSSTTRC